MKPFDPAGEYTPEEVKAALAGVSGTRQLSYRYERLDKDNQYIEDIDFIQSCTIENNALADIKRTAKLDVLDTGSINYLQDRIKPYVRIAMPEEKTYKDTVRSLNPSVWWALDDPATAINAVVYTFASDTTHASASAAYDVSVTSGTGIRPNVQTGSATVRSEAWMKDTSKSSQPLDIAIKAASQNVGFELYTSPDGVGDRLTLWKSGNVPANTEVSYNITFPHNGWIFARLIAQSAVVSDPYVTLTPSTRVEDSSGNAAYALGGMIKSGNKGNAIVSDGGSAFYSASSAAFCNWTTGEDLVPFKTADTGTSVNFWVKSELSSGQTSYVGFQKTYESDNTFSVKYEYAYGSDATLTFMFNSVIPNYVVTVPNRFIGTNTHMFTFTVDFETGDMKAYMDGVQQGVTGNISPTSGVSEYMATKIKEIFGLVNTPTGAVKGPTTVDDVAVFPKALAHSELSDLYVVGTSAYGKKRSGYVEWPLGVFVLSSPTRKMINGNTVVRAVEGYDQLVNLKEDSFDYRYSIQQGVSYTQAVRDVLQSSKLVNTVKLTDKVINVNGGSTITSDNSATMPLSSTTYGQIHTDHIYSILNISLSAKFSSSSTDPSCRWEFGMYSPNTSYMWDVANNVLTAESGGRSLLTATYAPTGAHKYLRLRESAGFMYWETSSDNVTWSVFASEKTTTLVSEGIQIWVFSSNGPANTTLTVTEFKATAMELVKASIETSTRTLPAAMEWDAGTPKLNIVNDLLNAINYTSATYDEDGLFVTKPYQSPQNRASQFRYATDSASVLVGDMDQTIDMFGVPNKWVLVVSDPDRPALVGTYVNADPMSPTSTVSRGRTIVDFRTEQSAADQVTLDAQAARLAFEASQVYEVIEFNTALMPIHQDSDVYELIIDGLAVNNKYAEHSWSMTLANGSPMRHRARRVVSV